MDREKEIEEMDEIIYQNACDIIRVCGTCNHGKKEELFTECVSPKIAKALINAGYRKADVVRNETVKEIFSWLHVRTKHGRVIDDIVLKNVAKETFGVEVDA